MTEYEPSNFTSVESVSESDFSNNSRLEIINSLCLDCVFILAWAIVTYVFNWLLEKIPLSNTLDKIILDVFVYGFAITTVIPVICFIFIDVSKVVKRTSRQLSLIWQSQEES